LNYGFGGNVLFQNTTAVLGTRLAQGQGRAGGHLAYFAAGFLRGGGGWSAFMDMKILGASKTHTHKHWQHHARSVHFCPHSGGAGFYFWVPVAITEFCLALVLFQLGFSSSLARHWLFSASARRQARALLRFETGPSRHFERSLVIIFPSPSFPNSRTLCSPESSFFPQLALIKNQAKNKYNIVVRS
jgi:hypothetical protein